MTVQWMGGEVESTEFSNARRRHVEKMDAIVRLTGGVTTELAPLVAEANVTLCELLEAVDAEREPGLHERLDDLRASLQRSAVVLRQLEAVSGANRRPVTPVDLHTVIANLRPLFPRLAGPFITVTEDLAAPSPWLMIEHGQIEQILLTLVVNARDAMPLGGALTIDTRREVLRSPRAHRHGELPAGTWLTLSVSDTGGGMDETTLSRIFEPFFTTKPPGLGSGLGLATLYGVVRHRDGQVVVATTEGKGTTLSVSFPEQPESALVGADDAPPQAVLVVDDDVWTRNVTARVLRRAGYGVLEAAHGEAALELLRDVAGHCIGTVLTDIQMPRLDGRELAEVVRREHPTLHVILMSGDASNWNGEPALLRKPFTADELLSAVHRSSIA